MRVSGGEIDFNVVIPTARGAIYACRFVQDDEIAAMSTDAQTKMNTDKAHGMLGHGSKESTRQTAKQLERALTRGKMKPCLYCARSKAKQKNVCKDSKPPKTAQPGERVYLDLLKVDVSREDGSNFEMNQKNWKSIVDKSTGNK